MSDSLERADYRPVASHNHLWSEHNYMYFQTKIEDILFQQSFKQLLLSFVVNVGFEHFSVN